LVGTSIQLVAFTVASFTGGLQKFAAHTWVHAAASVAGIGTNLVLILRGWGLLAIPIGMVVRGVVYLVPLSMILWLWCHRNLPRSPYFHRSELRNLLKLSGFTFLGRAASVLTSQMDGFLVAHFLTPASVVTLSMTSRALDPVAMAATRVGPALASGMANLAGEGDQDKLTYVVRRAGKLVLWLAAIGTGSVIALNAVFVSVWVGPQHYGGRMLTITLSAAMLANTVVGFMGSTLFSVGKIRETSIVAVVQAITNVCLQLILLKVLGLRGLPTATFVGVCAVSGIIYFGLMRKRFAAVFDAEMNVTLRAVAASCVVGLLLSLGMGWLGVTWRWPSFLVAAAVVGTILSAVMCLVDPALRFELSSLARRVFARRACEI